MGLQTILLEYLPRLQSCNVYIKIDKSSDNSNIKINLLPTTLVVTIPIKSNSQPNEDNNSDIEENFDKLQINSNTKIYRFDVSQYFHLATDSASGLTISEEEISLRIVTQNKNTNINSFEAELISQLSEYDSNIRFKPKVIKQESLSIKCKQCRHIFLSQKTFDRILELPSFDMADWFCHKHHDAKSIEPKSSDMFYLDFYVLLHPEIFEEKFLVHNDGKNILQCDQCLANVGTRYNNNYKIWNSSVYINTLEDENLFDISNKVLNYDMPIQEFIILSQKVISDNSKLNITMSCKIMYETKFTDNNINYLLIWILDSKLNVFKNDVNMKLIKIATCKLLFKVVYNDLDSEIIKSWNNDVGVTNVEISNNTFSAGVVHLEKMSEFIHSKYRSSNGFTLSYLNL